MTPNSNIEIQMPNVVESGDENFGERLGHENTAIIDEINALIKEAKRAPLPPLILKGHMDKLAVCNLEENPH